LQDNPVFITARPLLYPVAECRICTIQIKYSVDSQLKHRRKPSGSLPQFFGDIEIFLEPNFVTIDREGFLIKDWMGTCPY
jgi:hypothetical protein